MAKKNNKNGKQESSPKTFEKLGKKLDEAAPVRAAEEAVEKARVELERAQEKYRNVRQQAAEEIKSLREKNVGDVLADGLSLVRRYPGAGVAVAAFVGFFLGRLFRR